MRNYGYTYRGGPLIRWGHGTPVQSKGADAQALGILEESSLSTPTLYGSTILPAPGAPEPIGVSNQRMMQAMGDAQVYEALGGCSCSGTCGCGTPAAATAALSDISDAVPGGWITIGVGAFLVWHFAKKRRR
jgi:hypothetical protein